jgi:hypothetical protein
VAHNQVYQQIKATVHERRVKAGIAVSGKMYASALYRGNSKLIVSARSLEFPM